MVAKNTESEVRKMYVVNVGKNFCPDPAEPVMESIFQQYERVIIESLITSFCLDFLVKDQYGGDIDTIHNVRKTVHDGQMIYKNVSNQKDYEQRGNYNSLKYHRSEGYKNKNKDIKRMKNGSTLVDAYTGESISRNGRTDLDHVISAKEIHNDPGRVLADISGISLANSEENLQVTNPHTNRTKKADSMNEFLSKYGDEYTEKQKSNMRMKDAIARKAYEDKLARAYYTSPKFTKDLTVAAGNVGIRMGVRQALGFVFAEMWFSVKEEFQNLKEKFELGEFLKTIGNGIKYGFERAKKKYPELFSKFLSGAVSGVLSSITTTLCNIFFTTAKNTVKIIRQSYASLVEAGKILFINPDNYTFGDRMQAVVKILATGASIITGTIVSDSVGKISIATVPVLGDSIQTFSGTFVTGIMSCTLLYFFDRSEIMKTLSKAL